MLEYIKKFLGSGQNNNTTLIISNDEINDILKIVKSHEDFKVLLKVLTKQLKKNVKNKEGDFLV